MNFKLCYQKKIRQRVERILFDVYDFCLASRFCGLTMEQHPRLFDYFEDRHINISDCFKGVVFKNEDYYWQLRSDIGFARDLVKRDNLHIGLVPHLEELLDDLVAIEKGDTDVVLS